MTRFSLSLVASAALAAGLSCTPAFAQNGLDFSKVEIRTTQLAPDFWTLEGQGGTISVLAGPDGILLVDSQFAPLTDKLVAAIRRFSDQPIRFLVDTHVHPDHTGGNANFAKLGATIFARDQLRYRLEHPNPAADGTPAKPAPEQALPVVTYNASLSIHIDGEDVRLLPVVAAHTDGDTVVSFPGHGPIVDRNAVISQRDLILAVRGKVQKLVDEGKTLDQVIAARPTAEFDARVAGATPQLGDRFVRWVYAEVVASH